MTEREEEIRSFAAWAISLLSAIQILRNNDSEGHAYQLSYIFKRFCKIGEDKFGEDFSVIFFEFFTDVYGSLDETDEVPPCYKGRLL